MTISVSHAKTSRSADVEAKLDYPVIDYNPDLVDGELLERLFAEYGADVTRGRQHSRFELVDQAFGVSIGRLGRELAPTEIDDFALAGIEKVEDIRHRFVPNFFFGTESDDQTVVTAFNKELNPIGVKLNAFCSSDSGHWDVPDLTETLAESWELVERGLLSEADFKAFVFGNPYGQAPRRERRPGGRVMGKRGCRSCWN